ncbi:MAG: GTP-binding protein [Candidatus Nomurabacteria bacterium]|jgi:GTP-binding protein|nr:GTP-binding protein [Candidatus Nomurabacteria bacterium]
MEQQKIRNIAIIAHVDHGKTTLVDGLLKQSKTFRDNQAEMSQTLIMDSMDQEHERGITITAKQTAVFYKAGDGQDYKINIIDTPGHADFSGEVERTLNMADGVLLVVDAQEGPMPQTKFVLSKALGLGLKPIVIINKIDKPASRIPEVLDEVSDLFLELATDDSQLEYPVYYAIARDGKAWAEAPADPSEPADLAVIFDAIIREMPTPKIDENASKGAQLLITALGYDQYIGKLIIGKLSRGKLKAGEGVKVVRAASNPSATVNGSAASEASVSGSPMGLTSQARPARIDKIFGYRGLGREEIAEAVAGDIIAISGIDGIQIGETIATGEAEALPTIQMEAPTMSIYIGPNTSPLKGKEGEFTTSRQIADRLRKELETNISLRLKEDGLGFQVSGRGELHLSVLIESMRRDGFELEVGRPQVVYKEVDGVLSEPVEDLSIEVSPEFVGAVSQEMGIRRATLQNQETTSSGTQRFSYLITTAALIGLRGILLTATKGTVIMSSIPFGYQPKGAAINQNRNGALVAFEAGESTAYALSAAEARGELLIGAGTTVYQGMIVGINNKQEDLDINVCKGKQLTNMRSKASDGTIQLTPHTQFSLEQSLDFLSDDELLEVTPKNLRLRKRYLDPTERKRAHKNM